MRIVRFEDKQIKQEIFRNMKAQRLIPIIGSGFTRSSNAKKGKVPSGKDMKNDMINSLIDIFPDQGEKLKNQTFSKIAKDYEKHVQVDKKHRYLEDYFTKVNISDLKRRFLEINWPYVYTLNIDDGIEKNYNYTVVLPYEELNKDYLERNKCLFKLHGDVHDVLKYKNSNKYVFTEIQYLTSLRKNRYLLEILENDLISNNVFYIGCSLSDEIDILSIIHQFEGNPNPMKNTYFVTKDMPDGLEISNLEDFGVDTIILIDNYDDFYQDIYDLYLETFKIESDALANYLNPEIKIEQDNYDFNISYLFESNFIFKNFEKGIITLPYFNCTRDIVNDIINNIKTKDIQVVYGHRMSGKTYMLIDIMNIVNDRDIYFFPSTTAMNYSILTDILKKKNALLLFDSHTLSDSQIRYITNRADQAKGNALKIIICVNTSDREAISILSSLELGNAETHYIDNNFSDKELKVLNEKLSHLDIPVFYKDKSILDNIFLIDKLTMDRNRTFKVPEITAPTKEELVMMILLATKGMVSSYDIVCFDLSKEIGKFHDNIQPAIQYEYTSLLERGNHSGYKIIPNAKYWILKCLGDYSQRMKNQEYIAKAYFYIAMRLKQSYPDDFLYSKEMLRFIKFDVINDIFPRNEKGSINLINEIYDKLHDLLSSMPQYFHQRAKSKLWLHRDNSEELLQALKYAKKAKHDIAALDKNKNINLKRSLSHIIFTIALINGRILNLLEYNDDIILEEAIDSYYDALTDTSNAAYIKNLLARTKKYEHKDTADLKKLVRKVLTDSTIRKSLKEEQVEKVESIMTLMSS